MRPPAHAARRVLACKGVLRAVILSYSRMYGSWKSLLPPGAVALALAGAMLCAPVSAQPVSPSVGVVGATSDSMQALADAVDAALLRDLSAIAGIESPVVSPVDHAEIQLGVGCSDESRECLLAITRAVRVDALVLRRLGVDADGNGQLELTYFEAASNDAPTTVETRAAAAQMQSELVAAVPSLVRRLFGIAEVVEPAPAPAPAAPVTSNVSTAAPAPPPGDGPGVSAATWIALGAGTAALTVGIVVGWTAQRDFDDWKDMPVGSRDEADDARAAFDGIRGRAIAADVLLAIGAVGIGLGATLLVLDLGGDGERDGGQARVAVMPAPGGAIVRIEGALQDAF